MRIISGEAKGRTLFAPSGQDTRPTSDKIRGSLFNIIGARVLDARVMDLFGGTGALALEALSRGAQSAVLCDESPKACRVIQENIDSLGQNGRARLLRMKDTQALHALSQKGVCFDLIFLDPPYRMDTAPVCQMILDQGLLDARGVLVIEHSREKQPVIAPPLRLVDHRDYGAAGLSFYQLKDALEEN